MNVTAWVRLGFGGNLPPPRRSSTHTPTALPAPVPIVVGQVPNVGVIPVMQSTTPRSGS